MARIHLKLQRSRFVCFTVFESVPTPEGWVTGLITRQRVSGLGLGAINLFFGGCRSWHCTVRKRLCAPKVVRKDSCLLQSVHDPVGHWSRDMAPRNI
jgi:hypothetical protein